MFLFCHLENCTIVLALHASVLWHGRSHMRVWDTRRPRRCTGCLGMLSVSDWNGNRKWSWLECICDAMQHHIQQQTPTYSLNWSTFLWLYCALLSMCHSNVAYSLRMRANPPSAPCTTCSAYTNMHSIIVLLLHEMSGWGRARRPKGRQNPSTNYR